ncbi:hypothetical protein QMA02_24180 [Bacillus wiedmannii]|uniref:AAA family ATPase n=1 Tax=Bacillus wiedmannii TaxID=1890302 RepID=UPI0024AD2DB2|nr:AAA family ATPase [Bacillus wiedmannii]MDI6678906.1 hypothetical protein [Bacillus wiedmannii]
MLNEVMKESKQPLEMTTPHEANGESEVLVQRWESEMRKHIANSPTPQDFMFAYHTFEAWNHSKILDKPIVIAAPPGFGKSTMLSVYLRHMAREHSDTFGVIIVKERIEDMERLADYVNSEETQTTAGLFRKKKYAYVIKGYDESIMTREHYEEQFTIQSNYNIVIMTTKQFELQVLKDNLNSFASFRDDTDSKRPRRTLIIDEKPSLTIPYRITSADLNDLVDDIRKASSKSGQKLKRFYGRALHLINKLRTQIESPEIAIISKVNPVDCLYLLPRELLHQFTAVHSIEKLVNLRAFEHIVRTGGLVSLFRGDVIVQSTLKLHYEWTQFNSFVLDGTGRIDPEYTGDNFYLMEPNEKPNYSNVTFHICNDFSLSKSSIENDLDAVDSIADECKRIVESREGQVLIVTYKAHSEELEKRLVDEIESGKVIMKHFDGGRGSNHYVTADSAIYIGNLNKGGLYYPSTAQATVGDRLNIELSCEYDVNKKNGLVYRDPIVEEYKKLDMAVNMVQETNRLRANQKQNEVHFYVFNKDNDMIKHITDAYPHCRTINYVTANKLTGKKTSEDALIEYFANMPSGQEIKQAAIRAELDIHRNTFTKILQKERVQMSLKAHSITRKGNKYIKEAV